MRGMDLHFLGAATTVTGSQFLLETGQARILVDCGMFQGGPNESVRNRIPLAYDPATLDAILLTHAHLDHCGLIPHVVREGFHGPIRATAGTIELARLVLLDSGRLQEEFSKRENRWERRHPDRAEAEDARDRAALEAAIELAEAGEEGAAPTPAAAAFAARSREIVDDLAAPRREGRCRGCRRRAFLPCLGKLDRGLQGGPVPGVLGLGAIRVSPLPAVLALAELLLQPAGVEEHEARQLDRPGSRADGSVKSFPDHVRDQAAVVEVRVREQDRVERGGIVGQRDPVPDRLVRAPLEHPAVHEDACLAGLEKELAAGDGCRGAKEVEVHVAHGATGLLLRHGAIAPVTRDRSREASSQCLGIASCSLSRPGPALNSPSSVVSAGFPFAARESAPGP